jgi:hypothetical protein
MSYLVEIDPDDEPKLTISDYEAVIEDHKRLVRELDVALFGEGAAKQASLCDLIEPATKFSRAIHNAIRWHYFDLVKRRESADPSMSGMDDDILGELEDCVGRETADNLKSEGESLAQRFDNWSDIETT